MNASLLPTNSGAFEQSVSETSASRRQLPADLIRMVKSPDVCPADLLPVLAAEYSVDVWDEKWDTSKKRSVIRNAVRHHRLKGTLDGIKAYAGLADAEVLSVIRQPTKFIAGGSGTLEARIAWYQALPKIKIYRRHDIAAKRPTIFAAGSLKPFFLSRRFALPSVALVQSRPRAVLIREGIETEVGIAYDNEGTRMVLFRRQAGRRVFAGGFTGKYIQPSTATKSVARITYDGTDNPDFANPLRPAGTTAVLPTYGSDPKKISRRWYAGAVANRRFAGVPDAALRMFEQIPLADDLTPPEPRKSVSFASFTRLASPAHTAELKVSMPGKATRLHLFATARGAGLYAAPVDKARLGRAFKAMRAAKRQSDKVLINTQTYRPLLAGTRIIAGQTYLAGQMTRN